MSQISVVDLVSYLITGLELWSLDQRPVCKKVVLIWIASFVLSTMRGAYGAG